MTPYLQAFVMSPFRYLFAHNCDPTIIQFIKKDLRALIVLQTVNEGDTVSE